MARICKSCGSTNSFGSRFCEECGQKLEVKINVSTIKTKFNVNRNFTFTLIAIIVAILLLSMISNSIFGLDQSLHKYFRAIEKNDIELFLKAFPKQTQLLLNQKESFGDLSYEEASKNLDTIYNTFMNDHGENYRLRFKVRAKEYWPKFRISSAKDYLFETWTIPKRRVNKVISLTINMELKGKGYKEDYIISLKALKLGSKWYVYPENNSLFFKID